jgi:hypothetical protein
MLIGFELGLVFKLGSDFVEFSIVIRSKLDELRGMTLLNPKFLLFQLRSKLPRHLLKLVLMLSLYRCNLISNLTL